MHRFYHSLFEPLSEPDRNTRSARLALVALVVTIVVATIGCDKPSGDQTNETPNETTNETERSASKAAEEAAESSEDEAAQGEQESGAEESEKESERPEVLKGRVRPGRVTEVFKPWRKRLESVEIDESTAEKLGEVSEGATVEVYFGTWCSDSLREVPRLWKSLHAVDGKIPFSVEYVALDRNFDAGDASIEGKEIQFVPTFLVHRDGEEVGRIVESSPRTLERELLALLNGESEGVVSKRKDL